jgi:hypothetical protein
MRQRRPVLIITAVTITTLAGAVVAVNAGRARPGHGLPAAPVATATGAAGAVPGLGPVGRQLVWAVSLTAGMRQPGGPKGDDQQQSTTLTGDLVATISGVTAQGYDLALQLRQPVLRGEGFGQVSPEAVAAVQEKLGQRFWVSYQSNGAARELHFPRALSPDLRNLLALVITELQLVRPTQPAPQWTATERDAAGAYLTAYRQPTPGEIVKQKLRYLSADGGANVVAGAQGMQIDEARSRFVLDGDSRVAEADVRERTHIEAALGLPGFAVDIHLTVGKLRVGADPDLVGSLEQARPGLASSAIVTQRESEEVLRARQDAQLIAGVTLGSVLAELKGAATEPRVRARLQALLRLRPADVQEALSFARKADKDAARTVLESLGAAGTPTAQDALGAVARDATVPVTLRAIAIGSTVQVRRPTDSTLAWLTALLDDPDPMVRKQALFLTGAAGAACHDTDPAGAARVEAELVRRYRDCGAMCADLLVAMGNLGTAGVAPRIEEGLKSPDPRVRSAAARALRKLAMPSTDRLIAATMTGDREASVRAAALSAAATRPIAPVVESLVQLVRSDPTPYVRGDAIRVAGAHLDEAPQLEQVLLAVAKGDANASLQRLARTALGPRFKSN